MWYFGEETRGKRLGRYKRIINTAIGKMVRSVDVDGKNFDASKTLPSNEFRLEIS